MPNLTVGISMAWNLAAFETDRANYEEITPELLLCGITKLEDMMDPGVLEEVGLPKTQQESYLQEVSMLLGAFQNLDIPRLIRHKLRTRIGDGGFKRDSKTDSSIHRSTATKEIFNAADHAAEQNGKDFITITELMVAVLKSKNKNIQQVLDELGIDTTFLIDALRRTDFSVNGTLSPEEARRLLEETREDDQPELTISIETADGKARSLVLKQSEIVIGRRGGDQPIDIDLHPDRSISRQHARLFYQRHCWYIVDLGSTYGTVVDGIKISKERLILPSSRIQLGNSQISIGYESFATQLIEEQAPESTGIITNIKPVDELAPPSSISEDQRISVLAEIMQIAANAQTNPELFEGCIQKIRAAIPNAERVTILIGEDNELLPVKYYPREQPYYSNTFVNQARLDRVAFSWTLQDSSNIKRPESVFNAIAAMYAPMLRNKKIVGVLHVDSKSLVEGFSKSELDTLSVIANSIALALKPSKGEEITPSLFISYAHKDAGKVNRLKNDLRRNGISVWIDERLKVADEAWRKQLAIAIREQTFFLFVITPNSVSSRYCEWELDTAMSLEKPIIPIMLKKAELPITIRTLQYIKFGRDYKKALDTLVQRIQEQRPA